MSEQRAIIMHGLSLAEIDLVMRAAKKELENPRDVIFAKTTENSLKMKVKDLIEDLAEDHNYLRENPPEQLARKDGNDA
ncbi:MAG: DUF3783 domain-containing protein [Alkalispirochaeta sp.]